METTRAKATPEGRRFDYQYEEEMEARDQKNIMNFLEQDIFAQIWFIAIATKEFLIIALVIIALL